VQGRPGLTASEFAAIERVYGAAVPLDDLLTSDTAPRSKIDAATRAVRRACRKRSTHDPLLRALRAGCPAVSELAEATTAVGACSDAACLTRVLKSARAALRRADGGSRARSTRRTSRIGAAGTRHTAQGATAVRLSLRTWPGA
jgi:hypothetical protein